ncbi:hypothetical protein RUND412_004918 [Rhizina undulata]
MANQEPAQDMLEILTTEFNTLDSSLVAAIFNDSEDISKVRQILTNLAAVTVFEDIDSDRNWNGGGTNSCPEWGEWGSETDTDPTTMSMSSMRICEDDYEDDSPRDKADELAEMFPKFGTHTIRSTLDKFQGDVDKATDELLNRMYFDEDPEGLGAKGVDGFDSAMAIGAGKRKRKKNKKGGGGVDMTPLAENRRNSLSALSGQYNGNGVEIGARSRWDAMDQQIDRLSNGLHLPRATVTSAYHCHHSQVAPTLRALLDAHGSSNIGSHDPSHMEQLRELSEEFGHEVKTSHLDRLLKMCRENKPAVFEFAEILRSIPAPPEIKLVTQTTLNAPKQKRPVRDETAWTIVVGTSLTAPNPPRRRPAQPNMSFATAYNSAGLHTALRNEAFDKAAAAYRRSKSDRLMGGAAAFYADQGKSHDVLRKQYSDDAAEMMVNENSKPNQLDLHGVTAAQAVKLARERTTAWWVRCEGNRNLTPFRIVTGQGRHSKDGMSVLLPAVSKMLVKEGWKISINKGHILVYGVKKSVSR